MLDKSRMAKGTNSNPFSIRLLISVHNNSYFFLNIYIYIFSLNNWKKNKITLYEWDIVGRGDTGLWILVTAGHDSSYSCKNL